MAATKKKGVWVIPVTLATLGLLKLLPGKKETPLMKDLGVASEADMNWYRETLTALFDLLAAGRIKPVVAERIPLAEAARAHELLERGGYAGKVVLVSGA